MRPVYLLIVFILCLTACSSGASQNAVQTAIAETQAVMPTPTIVIPTETSIPTPTIVPTPTPLPEMFTNRLNKFVEEATKLNVMTEQGVNYLSFGAQLANVKSSYELAKAVWPPDYLPEVQSNIEKAITGWDLAYYIWHLDINDDNGPAAPDSNRYKEFVAYAGDKLYYQEGCWYGSPCLPADPVNTSRLLNMASEYYSKAQSQILGVLPQ